MSGQISYRERCVCGAQIEMTEAYSFISREEMSTKFSEWQRKHSRCLPLFHDIQKIRTKKLLMLTEGGQSD